MEDSIAEFNRKPDYVIVHNPCDFKMKEFFEKVDSKESLNVDSHFNFSNNFQNKLPYKK